MQCPGYRSATNMRIDMKGLFVKRRAWKLQEWQTQKSSSELQGKSSLYWKPKKATLRGGAETLSRVKEVGPHPGSPQVNEIFTLFLKAFPSLMWWVVTIRNRRLKISPQPISLVSQPLEL